MQIQVDRRSHSLLIVLAILLNSLLSIHPSRASVVAVHNHPRHGLQNIVYNGGYYF